MLRRTATSAIALLLLGACSGDATAPTAGPNASTPAAAPSATTSATQPPTSATPSPPPTPTASPSPTPTAYALLETPVPGAPAGVVTVAPFTDAATLRAALVAAEDTIASDAVGDLQVAEAAHVQQQAYRDLVAHPEWHDEVVAGLAADMAARIDANVLAGAELRALTAPRDELPPWTIVAPPPEQVLQTSYQAAQDEFAIPWEYLAAIHLIETRMGRIRGTSTAGAQGPMQFLPETWAAYGEGDINDPHDAIMAAGRYLAAHGAPDDMDAALYAYNHSDHYVRAIQAYVGVMREFPRSARAYYHWRVYYRLASGDVLLLEGYGE